MGGGETGTTGQECKNYRTAANGPGWASLERVGARAEREATHGGGGGGMGGRGTTKEPQTTRQGVVRQGTTISR